MNTESRTELTQIEVTVARIETSLEDHKVEFREHEKRDNERFVLLAQKVDALIARQAWIVGIATAVIVCVGWIIKIWK